MMDAALGRRAPGGVIKHSMVIAGHRTSVSLEPAFWLNLKSLAAQRGQSIAALVGEIDRRRGASNLSSAIRVFILEQVSQGHGVQRDPNATQSGPD